MAFISSAYLDNALTVSTHSALNGGTTAVDDQFVAAASAVVVNAARANGYSTLSVTTDLTAYPQAQATIQLATLCIYLRLIMPLRRNVLVPQELIDTLVQPEDIENGKVKLIGVPQDSIAASGAGSISNSGTAADSTGMRDPFCSVPSLTNYP